MTPSQALRRAAAGLVIVLGLAAAAPLPIASTVAIDPAAPGPTAPVTVVAGEETPATALDNPFLPENANIGDCVSALPRPDCGSQARGGWRQTLVFVALAMGLGLIAWRLVVALRRRDVSGTTPESSGRRPRPGGSPPEGHTPAVDEADR